MELLFGAAGRQWRRRSRQRDFTLLELLVVVALLVLLAAMLLPVWNEAEGNAKAAQCYGSLKHAGVVLGIYAFESGGYVMPYRLRMPATAQDDVDPPGSKRWHLWVQEVYRVSTARTIAYCPAAPTKHIWGIGHNRYNFGRFPSEYKHLSQLSQPDSALVFSDVGYVLNPQEPKPERWVESQTAGASTYSRWPNDMPWYMNAPWRPVGRHRGYLHWVNVDGSVMSERIGSVVSSAAGTRNCVWDAK